MQEYIEYMVLQGPAYYSLYLFIQQVSVTAYHGSGIVLVPKNTSENKIPDS